MAAPNLDLDLLRTFMAIVDEGTFTKAAGRLNCAQSTVSVQVARLELAAGTPLFLRLGRGTELTEVGELLRTYASGLIELNDEAVRRLRRPSTPGPVRLGMVEGLAEPLLPGVLSRFAAVHPGVSLEIRVALSADLLRGLGSGGLDVVLARREPGSRAGELVRRERLLWVDGPLPRSRDGLLPLVMFPHGCAYRAQVLKSLRARRRQWGIAFTGTSLASIGAAVHAGLGVTVLAEASVRPGMRILDEGEADLPRLPDTEVALFGGQGDDLASAMHSVLVAALRDLPTRGPPARPGGASPGPRVRPGIPGGAAD